MALKSELPVKGKADNRQTEFHIIIQCPTSSTDAIVLARLSVFLVVLFRSVAPYSFYELPRARSSPSKLIQSIRPRGKSGIKGH